MTERPTDPYPGIVRTDTGAAAPPTGPAPSTGATSTPNPVHPADETGSTPNESDGDPYPGIVQTDSDAAAPPTGPAPSTGASSTSTPVYPTDVAGSTPNEFDAMPRPNNTGSGEAVPNETRPNETGPNETAPSRSEAISTAKHEARQVADTAAQTGREVMHTAKDQATQVAAETKEQAVSLLDTARSEVGTQAATQQQRIAAALHDLSKELGSMASSSSESGWMTDLAHDAARRGGQLSHWLQEREPADVLDAVNSYARRRPATFLALCCLAGVLAGRITRSTVAMHTRLDSNAGSDQPGTRTASRAGTESPVHHAPQQATTIGSPSGTSGTRVPPSASPSSDRVDPRWSTGGSTRPAGQAQPAPSGDPTAAGGDPTR